jgi:signal transduction histidine kinase
MADKPPSTVLYVDDDETNRLTLSWVFRKAGFEVKEASTGSEALRLAEEKPDIVILDVNLPDIDGFEVCRRIKSHPATAFTPVLHLSASFVTVKDRVHGLESGADGYLTKPVDPQELLAQARALLRIREAEEKMRAAARQWQATFDAISDGVCLLDREGRVVRCNRALPAVLRRPAAEIVGRTYESLLRPPVAAGPAEPPYVLDTRQHSVVELALGQRTLQVIADPMFDDNRQFAGAVCILSDITERKRLEEQLRQAQKMDAIGRLAGGVAHDFNNLLTAITGTVSLLQTTIPRDDPNAELLGLVDKAAWRAAELTRQLLGFSRQTKLWLEPTDLNHAAEEVVGMLRRTIDPRITVQVHGEPELWSVRSDPNQIHQVLLNVCLNARDAMPNGGRLVLETANVVLREDETKRHLDARPGEFVRLRISDTGHGIPPDIQPQIFDPFFTTKGPGKGTGLGLAMVYGIVQQHHGWIECTSAIDQGTSFDIYLPRIPDDETPFASERTLLVPSGGSETILLVDDEPMIRELSRTILQRYGYRVLLAADGQEGIDVYLREQPRIDLVIMDMTMPRMSGRDAVKRLCTIDPNVAVIYASGYSNQVTDFASEGVLGFLPKPYREQELADAVRAALDKARANRQARAGG